MFIPSSIWYVDTRLDNTPFEVPLVTCGWGLQHHTTGMDSPSPGCDLDDPLGLSPVPSHFPVTTLSLWSPPTSPTEHHAVVCPAPLPSPPPSLPGSQGLKYLPILMTLKFPLLPRLLFWMPGLYIQLHSQLLCCILIGTESVLRLRWALILSPNDTILFSFNKPCSWLEMAITHSWIFC